MPYSPASYPAAFWSPLRISEVLLLQYFGHSAVAISFSFIQQFWVISTPYFLDNTILGQRIAFVTIQIYVVCYVFLVVSARFIDASRNLSRDSYRDTVYKYHDTLKPAIHFRDTDGKSNQPMESNLLALLTWITVLGSRSSGENRHG